MSRTVLITGAGGNIGTKLRAHFSSLGWTLRLLDVDARGDAAIQAADLAEWGDTWVATVRRRRCGDPSRRQPKPGAVLGLGAAAQHRPDGECI